MPGYKTHLALGLATFLLISSLTRPNININRPEELLLYMGAALLGSLFPDIDIASKMQNLFYSGASITLLIALLSHALTIFFLTSFFCFLVTILRHRTITHRIWFLIAFPTFTACCVNHFNRIDPHVISYLSLFFIGGALSHVILDKTISSLK